MEREQWRGSNGEDTAACKPNQMPLLGPPLADTGKLL